jgi:hypothetical protein
LEEQDSERENDIQQHDLEYRTTVHVIKSMDVLPVNAESSKRSQALRLPMVAYHARHDKCIGQNHDLGSVPELVWWTKLESRSQQGKGQVQVLSYCLFADTPQLAAMMAAWHAAYTSASVIWVKVERNLC